MGNSLNNHITSHYRQWVEYATIHVGRAGLSANPTEVVNEVLCYLLERKRETLERLIGVSPDALGLHYFILRVIRMNIYSPRSTFRYQSGPRAFVEVEECTQSPTPDDDPCEVHNLVEPLLEKMCLSERDKAIFVWKFFDKKRLSQWPGPEPQRAVYTAYNRVWKKIIQEIREKLGTNSIM